MAFTLDQVYRDVQDQLPREAELRAFVGSARYIDRIIRGYKGGRWSFDMTVAYLTVPAKYTTGTIAINNGSTTLTGSGTLWSTNALDSNWVIVIGSIEYPVSSVGGETAITLATPYVGSNLTASTYTAYQRQWSLASNLDRIYRVWNMTNQRRMFARTPMRLLDKQIYSPNDGTVDSYSLVGVDSSNARVMRVYPPSTSAAKLMYAYEKRVTPVTQISSTVDLPDAFREVFGQGCMARTIQLIGEQERAQSELRLFYSMLEDLWKKDKASDDLIIRFVRADMAEETTLWDLLKSQDVDTSVTI